MEGGFTGTCARVFPSGDLVTSLRGPPQGSLIKVDLMKSSPAGFVALHVVGQKVERMCTTYFSLTWEAVC